MRLSDFHYELPRELVAQRPLDERSASRLLCLDRRSGALRDCVFTDIVQELRAGDLLVFNDTRVVPARLLGRKRSGGSVEILLERILEDRRVLAQVRASKSPREGTTIALEGGGDVRVLGREGSFFVLEFAGTVPVMRILEQQGHVPLPPYIDRGDEALDVSRYQTVYARVPGAVAAPTAGLHFDRSLMARLAGMGVDRAFVTLHVGAGTFQPLRVQDIRDHRMHAERITVTAAVCEAVERCRRRRGRVVAVGTTSVRALESAAREGALRPFDGETRLFVTPGFRFRVVDALITNFHLPESTLLMLVSAFGGHGHVMVAYRHAVAQRYRFFSYGDAMLVH